MTYCRYVFGSQSISKEAPDDMRIFLPSSISWICCVVKTSFLDAEGSVCHLDGATSLPIWIPLMDSLWDTEMKISNCSSYSTFSPSTFFRSHFSSKKKSSTDKNQCHIKIMIKNDKDLVVIKKMIYRLGCRAFFLMAVGFQPTQDCGVDSARRWSSGNADPFFIVLITLH